MTMTPQGTRPASLTSMIDRVLRRVAAKLPTTLIGGHPYVLSTFGGALGDMDDPMEGVLYGQGSKWRYLWVLDTEKHVIGFWRAGDGNEKLVGPARQEGVAILKLERMGQLNRVSHADFEAVVREMRRREDATTEALAASIERDKTDYQRLVEKHARAYYEKHIVPLAQRALKGVTQGVVPLGFKPNPRIPVPAEQQAQTFLLGQILSRELTEAKVDSYLKHGVDPEAPGQDVQAVYWALGDLRDEAYETLRS